jgi:NAD(P)H-nitrite reductase large subunit
MKRVNMKQAFVGEPDRSVSDIENLREGNEMAILEVTGGTLSLIIDGDTEDSEVFDNFKHVYGEVILENHKIIRFQLSGDGAANAIVVDLSEETVSEPGLSSVQNLRDT